MGGKGKTSVWVDCDPGHDDVCRFKSLTHRKAFALAYAPHSSHLTLTGTSPIRICIVVLARDHKEFEGVCGFSLKADATYFDSSRYFPSLRTAVLITPSFRT